MMTVTFDEKIWQLVPIDLTNDMLDEIQEWAHIIPPRGKRIWQMLLRSAPTVPTKRTQDAVQISIIQPPAGQQDRGEEGELAVYAKAMDVARLQGRLEAFAIALTECGRTARRDGGSVGARDCREIRMAIDILHLNTLQQMEKLK